MSIVHTRNIFVLTQNLYSYHLKDGLKENVDYKVLDHATWTYLKSIYGAVYDIPRFSVAVPVGMDKTDYLVEINLRRFQIAT